MIMNCFFAYTLLNFPIDFNLNNTNIYNNSKHKIKSQSSTTSTHTEVSRRQLVANFRRAGFDAVKAVVTHLGTPLWEAPRPAQSYPLSPPSASVCVTRVPC